MSGKIARFVCLAALLYMMVCCGSKDPRDVCRNCKAIIEYANTASMPVEVQVKVKSYGQTQQRQVSIPAQNSASHEYYWDGVGHIRASVTFNGQTQSKLLRNEQAWMIEFNDRGVDWGLQREAGSSAEAVGSTSRK
ncbi:MAG: hypothetical protein GF398_08830 [Chitinivibrionales bacterium]|nr:hypothetical protein [Chitinivibrionales bacterium]